jgi:hypothetical protein
MPRFKDDKKMYNEEQKNQFINTISFNNDIEKSNVIRLFIRLGERAESQLELDFSEMSFDDLKLSLSLLGGKSLNTLSWNIAYLKQYYQRCINTGKTSRYENAMNRIKPEDVNLTHIFKIEMLKNPDQLSYIHSIVYPMVDEERVENVYQLYQWLLYDGINNKDVVELKNNDVDLENGFVKLKDKKIKLSEWTKLLADYVINTEGYVGERGGKTVTIRKADSDYLLTGYFDVKKKRAIQYGTKIRDLNIIYKKETKQYINLTPNSIYESGIFYRTFEDEMQGKEISFEEYAREKIKSTLDNEYNYNYTIKKIESRYQTWKLAFELYC